MSHSKPRDHLSKRQHATAKRGLELQSCEAHQLYFDRGSNLGGNSARRAMPCLMFQKMKDDPSCCGRVAAAHWQPPMSAEEAWPWHWSAR